MLLAIAYPTLAVLLARPQRDRRVRIGVLAGGLLLTVMIGISRVYLGGHWPTRILGGWATGSAWLLCKQIRRFHVRIPASWPRKSPARRLFAQSHTNP